MTQHGGSRKGSGRKPKADEEKVKNIATTAIIEAYGSLEDGMRALLTSGETTLIKFVFEHALGKPREKMDLDLEDHTPVILNETKNYLSGINHKADASN